MKHIIFIVSLTCLFSAPFSWSADWQSEVATSYLKFAPSYEGMPINGTFNQFAVRYSTDQQGNPRRLDVEVIVASADMGNGDINSEIRAADWFNIVDFPKATFVSEKFTFDEQGDLLAHGVLQLKGYEKRITVPFSWQSLPDGKASIQGEVILGRNDFSIGSDEWASGDQIGLAVKVWFAVALVPVETNL